MGRYHDLTGEVFGKLTVVGMAPKKEGRVDMRWFCRCECGNNRVVCARHLRRGSTSSCGCVRIELLKDRTFNMHRDAGHSIYGGACGSPENYNRWHHMMRRCYDPNHASYRDYGGRGIRVCERWRNSIADFNADIGEPPKGMSLDRINVNGDYSPENCQWADALAQAQNRRNSRKGKPITGKTQPITGVLRC